VTLNPVWLPPSAFAKAKADRRSFSGGWSGGSRAPEPLELWGGVECTINRVGERYHNQLELTGHARRPDDLDRIAALGIRRLRYPVLWESVAPTGVERADWTWADQRLERLRQLHISPIVGLVHHGSGPPYATVMEDGFAAGLARYARTVAERYPWVDAYTPVNEPLTTARFCGLYGHWFPHQRSDASFVRVLLHECRGVTMAMMAIRQVNPAAALVQTDDGGKVSSTARLSYQADFENERRWLAWDLVAGRVDSAHPMWWYLLETGAAERELWWFVDHPCRIDVIGLNYYATSDRFLDDRTERYPGMCAGGNRRHAYVDTEAVRAHGAIDGHLSVLRSAWDRYRVPVAITEAHLGCTREEQMRWLLDAWRDAHRARATGVDVRGVTAWALLGLSDWDSLVTRVGGHYEPGAFDARGPVPRPTALASLIADLTSGRSVSHPAAAGAGWWRRTQPSGEPSRRFRAGGRRPLLILGAGTLGRALANRCESRGLAFQVLPHSRVDIADGAQVERAIKRVRPWAVVNAAGYSRVDLAEQDRDRCRRSNTLGAAVLARACARAHLPLVTFSTDLVFDGQSPRPYTESDPVQPLSVYGESKADAERDVLDAHARALVIRAGATFGASEESELHVALEALASRIRWSSACDVRVSPTYLPDFVNASLDLLVDGAEGIWHLANPGDVSWFEFVCRAAELCGYQPDLIQPCPAANLEWAAQRPVYSVLGSERGCLLRPLDEALDQFAAGWRARTIASPCETGAL
jgi:dTDP-4-dehydrorhamnose reductase